MSTLPPAWQPPAPLPGPLETGRLVVRWWTAEDAPALYQAVDEDRAALLPWMPWARDGNASIEAAAETVARFDRLRAAREDFTLGAFDRQTGAVVGGTGFHRLVPAAHEAECGYWIRGARQREGLCTEMTRAMISAGFRDWGFRRIHLQCAAANAGSRGVLEKLGLPLEGRLREARWVDGLGWEDHLVYGVLAEDWDIAAQALRTTG